jgi:hypothetical protein
MLPLLLALFSFAEDILVLWNSEKSEEVHLG